VPGARGPLRGVALSRQPGAREVDSGHSRGDRSGAVIASAAVIQAPEVRVPCVVAGVAEGAAAPAVASAAAGGARRGRPRIGTRAAGRVRRRLE
jgi:hypothetical protein